MATYVLVHGAWDGGWFWRPVATLLRQAGHDVFTPTLTGLGERVHLASPEVGLQTHIQDVLGVLQYEDIHDVVLVGYSYSGIVVTGVAERVPERLGHLVYVDAFVPQNGQAGKDLLDPDVWSQLMMAAQFFGEGWRVPHNPPDAKGRTPALVKPFTESIVISNLVSVALPRTFVYCLDKSELGALGKSISEAAERAKKEGWQYRELPSGHAPMQTHPQELAAILLELI